MIIQVNKNARAGKHASEKKETSYTPGLRFDAQNMVKLRVRIWLKSLLIGCEVTNNRNKNRARQ